MIRTIAKTTFEAHTDPIFQNLGILKFHDIYLLQLGLFMYSYQNHTLPLKFHCKFTFPCKNLLARSRRDRCQNRVAFLAGFRGAIAVINRLAFLAGFRGAIRAIAVVDRLAFLAGFRGAMRAIAERSLSSIA